jgi:hypothetical protein
LWDGEAFSPRPKAARVASLADDLEALRQIFQVNDRAHFEFVVTAASLAEVQGRGDRRYTQWVRDLEDTWLIQSEGNDYERQPRQQLGSVSEGLGTARRRPQYRVWRLPDDGPSVGDSGARYRKQDRSLCPDAA